MALPTCAHMKSIDKVNSLTNEMRRKYRSKSSNVNVKQTKSSILGVI